MDIDCKVCNQEIPTYDRKIAALRGEGFCSQACKDQKSNPKPFMIVYPRGLAHQVPLGLQWGDFTAVMYAETMAEALAMRQLAGDVVCDARTKRIVEDESWLWEWERRDKSDSFAYKCIEAARGTTLMSTPAPSPNVTMAG